MKTTDKLAKIWIC